MPKERAKDGSGQRDEIYPYDPGGYSSAYEGELNAGLDPTFSDSVRNADAKGVYRDKDLAPIYKSLLESKEIAGSIKNDNLRRHLAARREWHHCHHLLQKW